MVAPATKYKPLQDNILSILGSTKRFNPRESRDDVFLVKGVSPTRT